MLESKAVIGETDMLQTMQIDALKFAGKALDVFEASDATAIARFIKKVLWVPTKTIKKQHVTLI